MATKSTVSTIGDKPQDAEVDAVAAPVVKGANFDSQMSGNYEIVTIQSTNDDGGGDAVFVSLNGYAYQIPRDKPYRLPSEVVQVLRDAVTTVYAPGSNGVAVAKDRPRYSFSTRAA